jgi:hypothetical protein
MSIERNGPCPCGKSRKFKQCCGRSADATSDLYAAVHEIGHALVLPKRARPHVSFQNPCSQCGGEEGTQTARAHTGFEAGLERTGVDELLYSLAGGAAEVACGLSPLMKNTEFGSYPASMSNDFENLQNELNGEMWDSVKPFLRDCFNALVNYFREIIDRIWAAARDFLDKRVLTHHELGLVRIDRNAIVRRFGVILNLPDPPESAIE